MDLSGGFESHLNDLLDLASASDRGAGVVAIGHSFGGVLVQAAALRAPNLFASIGAFESPMPWLGFHRSGGWSPLAEDPGDEAERFFRRMMGDHAWERMADGVKLDRRADGPALVTDLQAIRTLSFDVTDLSIPVVYGTGVAKTAPHHLEAVEWLGANVHNAAVNKIEEAGHGAHLSHPDAFARFIGLVIDASREEVTP
jgi:pimeloyl-ACP methyl ester carboxylesterase